VLPAGYPPAKELWYEEIQNMPGIPKVAAAEISALPDHRP
jgi:hypothetical protein